MNDWYLGPAEEAITEQALTATSVKLFPAETVLMAMYGDGKTITTLGILREPAASNQACAAMIANPDVCEPKFLFYALKARRHLLIQLALGGAQRNLSAKTIKGFEIPAPPLEEQRRIAGILSAYDDLIENCQRRIKILEEMARSLYREWFGHFRYPGQESTPSVLSDIGSIPEGWGVKRLRDLVKDNIGGGWGKDEAMDGFECPAWVIRGTDIPAARNNEVGKVPFRYHAASNLRSRRLAVGDIVFEVSGGSKGQPVGRSLLISKELMSAFGADDVICASFCKRIVPADGYVSELLWLSLLEGYENGEIEQFQVQSTGISNFKWTEYLHQTLRCVPPSAMQQRFRTTVAPVLSEIGVLGLKVANLRKTRDLLLPKLIGGPSTE